MKGVPQARESSDRGRPRAVARAPALHIRLLGDLELRLDDAPLGPIESVRVASLLVYLLLHRDAPQRRQYLAFLLWPDSREAQARTNLRHALHGLRRALPDADRFLDVRPATLQWRPDAPCSLDVATFEAALERAAHAGDGVVKELQHAVDAYRGDLLPAMYDEWLTPERERLRRRFLEALERLASLHEARGALADAVGAAERLLRHDPLREDSYRLLMRLYAARGERARALHTYHLCAATLERELEVAPSPATRRVYEELLGSHEEAPPPPRDRETSAWPRVGREAEWRRLTNAWLATERGGAQLALVTGEAGAGKTRLVSDLAAWCAHRGAVVAEARSYAAEGALAYGPVVAWLRAPAFAPSSGALAATPRAELARLLPELGADPTRRAAPEGDQRRLFEAAAAVLLSLGTPLLLVLDDAQWCDGETLRFLHYLLRLRPAARLMVAATARREEIEPARPVAELVTGLRALERCVEVELGRLTPEETLALAEHVAGSPLDAADRERLYGETEGNPLFVVEAMRAESRGADAARRWLSPKVHAVIQSRLMQLSEPARALAGAAAVIGTAFTSPLLSATVDIGESAFINALDELWRRGILREQGADTYDFSHDKIREAAYLALSPALRRRHHLAVARALENLHADRLEAVAGQLAAHLERAGATDDAVRWYVRAADAARDVYADAEALRLLERALSCVASSPESPGRVARELEVLTAMPASIGTLEGFGSPRLVAVQQRALELARSSGVALGPPLVRSLAVASLTRGDFAGATERGEELQHLGTRAGDRVLTVEGAYVLGIAAFWQGRLATARAHFQEAVAHYHPSQAPAHLSRYGLDPKVVCLSRLANTLFLLGEPDEAGRSRDAALALAEELGHPHSRQVALVFAGTLAIDMGDVERLRSYAAALRARVAPQDGPHLHIPLEVFHAYLDVLDGNAKRGVARVRRLVGDGRGVDPAPGTHAMMSHLLVETCAAAGDATAGLAAADAALATAGLARIWEPELRRRRAEFMEALGAAPDQVTRERARADEAERRRRRTSSSTAADLPVPDMPVMRMRDTDRR